MKAVQRGPLFVSLVVTKLFGRRSPSPDQKETTKVFNCDISKIIRTIILPLMSSIRESKSFPESHEREGEHAND